LLYILKVCSHVSEFVIFASACFSFRRIWALLCICFVRRTKWSAHAEPATFELPSWK